MITSKGIRYAFYYYFLSYHKIIAISFGYFRNIGYFCGI